MCLATTWKNRNPAANFSNTNATISPAPSLFNNTLWDARNVYTLDQGPKNTLDNRHMPRDLFKYSSQFSHLKRTTPKKQCLKKLYQADVLFFV